MFVFSGKFASLCLSVCLLCVFGSASTQEHAVITVEEGSDVNLPCSLGDKINLESRLIDWTKDGEKGGAKKNVFLHDTAGDHYNTILTGQDKQFEGRVFHFQDELKKGNASILIKKTTLTDSGNYTCVLPHPRPGQEFKITLIVFENKNLRDRSGEIKDAASKPSMCTLDQTKDWALVQCEVLGASPEPKVQFEYRNGTVLQSDRAEVTEKDGRFDVISTLNVTKTGHYSCVVIQEEIKHRISSETYVFIISDKVPEDISSNVHLERLAWIAVGVLLLAVVLAVVWLVLRQTKGIAIIFKKAGPQEGDVSNPTNSIPLIDKPLVENGSNPSTSNGKAHCEGVNHPEQNGEEEMVFIPSNDKAQH